MIIHAHKCVFIHTPKTGGMSFEKRFAPNLSLKRPNTKYFVGWNGKHKIWMQHASMQQVNDLYETDLTEYFKFGFVRNPWDRSVSDYVWLISKRRGKNRGTFLNYLLSRGNFRRSLTVRSNKNWRGDHVIPQFSFLFDSDGNQLVDFIGRFENLQADFDTVCDKIGIEQRKLPHLNKTKHKHYTEHYDDRNVSKSLLKNMQKTLSSFGYEFGN